MEKIEIYELHERQPLLAALTEVWEASVRAAHSPLTSLFGCGKILLESFPNQKARTAGREHSKCPA